MPIATPEELEKYPPPPLPIWVRDPRPFGFPDAKTPLLLKPEDQFQFFDKPSKTGKIGEPYWVSSYGSQTWGLVAPFDEVCVGGQRGGGKSAMLIAWFATGDPFLTPDDPARYSFLLEPSYRGLMLRKEYQSLSEFIDEAEAFFAPLGGKPKDDPVVFEFDKGRGAKIYTNHLGDRAAFEKYRGMGITRIGIEELTQIEDQSSYLKLLGSLRAKRQVRIVGSKRFPALRSQIMSTTNPDGPGACVPYGDVLTENGWKPIEQIRIGDRVWSVEPVSGEMVLKMVDQVHASHFDGELYQAEGRGLHVCTTPNHKILRFNTTKKSRSELKLQEIDHFPGQATITRAPLTWRGSGPRTVEARSMRRRREPTRRQPVQLAINEYASLVGWMVTEGCLVKRDNALCVTQVKPEGRKELQKLFDKCGFRPTWDDKQALIYSHEWVEHFAWLPHALKKFVPTWIKNLPVTALGCLMDAMVAGDGHRTSKNSGYFFSSSPQLASDFCEIALKCGYMVYATGRDRGAHGGTIKGRPIRGRAYAHEISYHRQKVNGSEVRTGNHAYDVSTQTKRTNVKRVPFSGPVYCVGVPGTHTFFIRQKGCVWISGNSWVKKRFVKVYDKNGKIVPRNHPMIDPITRTTRIFIPMTRQDNPYLRDNKQYEGFLLAQDEATKQAWIHGNWDFLDGTFFGEFRPDGPVTTEEREKYPWAKHVIDPAPLSPWWHRWGGGDWGYDHPAAFHKFCRNEKDGRIHCYDELMLRQYGSYEVGVKLAQWWLPDLMGLPDKTVTIAFSSDAFSTQDDTRTKAEQVANGIRSVLGPYGAFLLKFTDDERALMAKDPSLAQRKFAQHKELAQGNLVIVLKPASKDVVARWSYMRELLRFRPILQETEKELEARLQSVYGRAGIEAYERERAKVRRPGPENLPRLQIWKGKCPQLVRCIAEATKDEKQPEKIRKFNATEGQGGDDALESAGHGLHHFKDVETVMPKSYFVSDRIEQVQAQLETETGERITDQTRLIMVHKTAEARYDRLHPPHSGNLYVPRASSGRHRHGAPPR